METPAHIDNRLTDLEVKTSFNEDLLEQLNQQTQSLYNEVQSGIVRVQLPVPLWAREAAAKKIPVVLQFEHGPGAAAPYAQTGLGNDRRVLPADAEIELGDDAILAVEQRPRSAAT